MDDDIFAFRGFRNVHPETQTFAPGFSPDDFHDVPGDGHDIQKLSLQGDRIAQDRIGIEAWRFDTNFDIAVCAGSAYLFEAMGLARIDLATSSVVAERLLVEERGTLSTSGFLSVDPADGSLVAAVRLTPSVDSDRNSLEIRRYTPTLDHTTLVKLPVDARLIAFPDGFALLPPTEPRGGAPGPGVEVYDIHAARSGSSLENSLNALLANGVRFGPSSGTRWQIGKLWCQGIHRPWALFSEPASPDGPSGRTSVLTIGQPPLSSGLDFDTGRKSSERVEELVVSPKQDLFFAAVRGEEDSTGLWLGMVRREGDRYHGRTFRVRPFDEIRNLCLSRDGSTLLFATRRGDDWGVAGAGVDRILREVGRLHPDAEPSLAALVSAP